jgi:hypothetical protein
MKNPIRSLTLVALAILLAGCNLSSWLTYTNATYHFQFQYPSGSTVVTDTPTAARIQLPITPGTNLVEKYLDVSVEQGAIPCLTPYSMGYMPPGVMTTGTATINGIYWVIEEGSEGAMGSFYQWKAYSTYYDDQCISMSFVLHSTNPGMYETPPPEFDLAQESLVFSLIMNTFTWLEELPTCATEALIAPALVDPADGSEVGTLNPSLHWIYPDDCAPEGYRIDLSTDPTFTDTSLSGGTGNPSTTWGPGEPLEDCTTYFWRVAPINDITLGPFSGAYTFRTNVTGACAPEAPASISGSVWVDECSVALDVSPVPDPLPLGCALTSYGVDGDGVHQEDEYYVFGAAVYLGQGDCPQTGPWMASTDGSGAFSFDDLAPGKYCLNINAATIYGEDALGHWTLVPSGHEGNSYRSILLGAGQDLTAQDFAFYLVEDVITPTPVDTFTPTPAGMFFVPDENANCRFGPDLVFEVDDFAMLGEQYPIDGRNAANTWFRIMLSPNHGCWVAQSMGHTLGDLSDLRVLISPATPTPVPVCSLYTSRSVCSADPACVWVQLSDKAGVCNNK